MDIVVRRFCILFYLKHRYSRHKTCIFGDVLWAEIWAEMYLFYKVTKKCMRNFWYMRSKTWKSWIWSTATETSFRVIIYSKLAEKKIENKTEQNGVGWESQTFFLDWNLNFHPKISCKHTHTYICTDTV